MRRIALLCVWALQLSILLGWGTLTALAQDPCPRVHVVAAGDSLWRIAQQYGVPVQALIDRNAITNPSLIRPGQEICVPLPATPREATVARGALPADPQIIGFADIVAEYRISRTNPETRPLRTWTLSDNAIGLRHSYTIALNSPVSETLFLDERKLFEASAQSQPALWLIHDTESSEQMPRYTLAVIGAPEPLLSVQFPLSETQQIDLILPDSGLVGGCAPENVPVDALGRGYAETTRLWLDLAVAPNRSSLRFPVDKLQYWSSGESLANCEPALVLALHPIADADAYELYLLLERNSDAAPGGSEAEAVLCEVWEDGNWIEKIMWVLKCPDL